MAKEDGKMDKKDICCENLENVNGGTGVNRHPCGACGSEMIFLREQEGASRYVFECPRCGEVDVFDEL